MDEILQQLMQMQAPPQSLGGNFSGQQNPQQTLGQMFSDPNVLRHQPLAQDSMPLPTSLNKMPPGFMQTYAGQKQAQSEIKKFNIEPKDETALQAQGQRTMKAIQGLQK